MKIYWVFYLAFVLGGLPLHSVLAAELPDLTIQLGDRNYSSGLFVPSGGDGRSVPETIQGLSVRRTLDPYLYVGIEPHVPEYNYPQDLYVIAEFMDDAVALVTLEFDQAAATPSLNSTYTASKQVVPLTGTNKWITQTYFLPQARLGHGQNGNADFRLCAKGIAVRRITVSTRRPPGFEPEAVTSRALLLQNKVDRRPGMEVTFGNDASLPQAGLLNMLSVTSVESYVDWAGVEPAEGLWDWNKWDRQVATLKSAGMKWVPFLIAGPAYATPLWFQNGPNSHYYRCLEHGKDSKVQSLFNPQWPAYVERFIKAFAARYRDQEVIESVLLGISGIFGESIYPAGPDNIWTTRLTGDYHYHDGWWAGDVYAAADFRAAMQRKYHNITALNRAWKTRYAKFADVSVLLPKHAPSDRARSDMVEWYQQAMTDWAVYWAKTVRKYFPKTEIYLATGGNGDPMLGADFTAQVAAIAGNDVGVRITNEGSDFVSNFTMTREVASATRFYKTFSGFEPGSSVTPAGIINRIYNATSSGARQLHDYENNTLGSVAALNNFRSNAAWLKLRQPRINVAFYLSRETWALDPTAISETYNLAATLRDITDLDFVTRRSVLDGHLKTHQVLVLSDSSVLEPKVAETIEKWVNNGGILIASSNKEMLVGGRLYDLSSWRDRMLTRALPKSDNLLLTHIEGSIPEHWVLNIGVQGDEAWLLGSWHDREKGLEWPDSPDAHKRWSGMNPQIQLPTLAGADYLLKLVANIPGYALKNVAGDVLINGHVIGKLYPGLQNLELHVPQSVVGERPLAILEFKINTWKPSDFGTADNRILGIAVNKVEWIRSGAKNIYPAKAQLRTEVNLSALDKITRRVGRGRSINLSVLAGEHDLIARILSFTLGQPVDGKLDNRYVTETADGYLWFDATKSEISLTKP